MLEVIIVKIEITKDNTLEIFIQPLIGRLERITDLHSELKDILFYLLALDVYYDNGMHFIGNWESFEQCKKYLIKMTHSYASKSIIPFVGYFNSKNGEFKKDFLGNSEKIEKSASSNSKSVTENSPINSVVGDILTPTGKGNNVSNGSSEDTHITDNSINELRRYIDENYSFVTILRSIFECFIEEYTNLY